jgi:ATP-dependent exoDNAse (exonuclease V) beta subunit
VHAALKNAGHKTMVSGSDLWTAVERAEAERLVQNILASPIMTRARVAATCFAEVPFTLHYQNHKQDGLLEGVIDLAFIENGAWVVVDFKTDLLAPAELSERVKAYRLQLNLYALALERLTDSPVKDLVLLFARSQQEVVFTWDDAARTAAQAILAAGPGLQAEDGKAVRGA